jgi:short-subunit dehydrogenase
MKGGPSQSTRISADECAKDIVKGIVKNKASIFPGAKINRLMKFYLLLPWSVRRRILENDAKKMYKTQHSK